MSRGRDRASRALAVTLVVMLLGAWSAGAAAQTSETETPTAPLKSGPVVVDLDATFFSQGFVAGNATREFDFSGRLDAVLHIDGEEAGLWKGFSVESRMMYRFGDDFGALRGGTLGPYNTTMSIPLTEGGQFALTSLVIKQNFDDKVIVDVGRTDFIADSGGYGITGFWHAAYAAPLINAMTTPSVSPLVVGVTFVGTERRPTMIVQVFDPRNSPTTSGLTDLFSEGVAGAVMLEQPTAFGGEEGSFLFRVAYSSKETTDFENPFVPIPGPGLDPQSTEGGWSGSLDFTQSLGQAAAGGWKATTFVASIGLADPGAALFETSGRLWVLGTSPLAENDRDNWGVGFFYSGLSDALETSIRPLIQFQDEFGFSSYFDWDVTRWFTIGANAQVIKPGTASFGIFPVPSGPVLSRSEEFGTNVVLGFRGHFRY